jgi:uncharacterized paraquat-inducible protein A
MPTISDTHSLSNKLFYRAVEQASTHSLFYYKKDVRMYVHIQHDNSKKVTFGTLFSFLYFFFFFSFFLLLSFFSFYCQMNEETRQTNNNNNRYWCHICNAEVQIYMAPDPTCQRCNEQFIEEV